MIEWTDDADRVCLGCGRVMGPVHVGCVGDGTGTSSWGRPRAHLSSTSTVAPVRFGCLRLTAPALLQDRRPRAGTSHDENCNPVAAACLWPLGGVEVWLRGFRRTDADGMCQGCLDELSQWARGA